ncbi:MAG: hypothetical protein OER85_09220 [Gammaproteobacteria bacterium]|nr:hypothetical protein [Gammaproteobacteria bacterium]
MKKALFPGNFKLLADEPVEAFEPIMQTNLTGTFSARSTRCGSF